MSGPESRTLPLTRRLSSLEVFDAGIGFIRNHPAEWTVLAGTVGAGLALGLAALQFTASFVPAGRSMSDHFGGVALGALMLAGLALLRGPAAVAATEYFRRKTSGLPAPLGACVLRALKAPVSSAFLAAVPGAVALLGLCAMVYPGLAAWNRWAVAIPAAVYEGLGASAAMTRSARLMERSTAGMSLALHTGLLGLFVFANLLVLGALLPDLLRIFLGTDLPWLSRHVSIRNGTYVVLAAGLSMAAADAARMAGAAVLYLNMRIEREGSDLKTRLERLRASHRHPEEALRA